MSEPMSPLVGTCGGHQTWPGMERACFAQSLVGIRARLPSRNTKHLGT